MFSPDRIWISETQREGERENHKWISDEESKSYWFWHLSQLSDKKISIGLCGYPSFQYMWLHEWCWCMLQRMMMMLMMQRRVMERNSQAFAFPFPDKELLKTIVVGVGWLAFSNSMVSGIRDVDTESWYTARGEEDAEYTQPHHVLLHDVHHQKKREHWRQVSNEVVKRRPDQFIMRGGRHDEDEFCWTHTTWQFTTLVLLSLQHNVSTFLL